MVSSNPSPSCALKSLLTQFSHMTSIYLRLYLYCQKSIDHSEKKDDKFHTITIWTFKILFQERFLQNIAAN